MERGQALVEFMLVFPVMALVALGFGEGAFLVSHQHGYQNEADVLASWAADHPADVPGPSWDAVAASENSRVGCDGTPVVSWPDGSETPGSRVLVNLTCKYTPVMSGLWSGLPVAVESEAVVQ